MPTGRFANVKIVLNLFALEDNATNTLPNHQASEAITQTTTFTFPKEDEIDYDDNALCLFWLAHHLEKLYTSQPSWKHLNLKQYCFSCWTLRIRFDNFDHEPDHHLET
jgi:hypothetical protein